jgi:hypothetical protein
MGYNRWVLREGGTETSDIEFCFSGCSQQRMLPRYQSLCVCECVCVCICVNMGAYMLRMCNVFA